MTPPATNRHHPSAFTLLELLVAVALTGLLVGILAFTFSQSSKIKQVTESRISRAREIQGAFDQLARDLREILPSAVEGFRLRMEQAATNPPNGPTLRADLLEFTSRVNVGGEQRLVRIRYSLTTGEIPQPLNPPRLIRRVDPILADSGSFILDPDVPGSEDLLVDRLDSFSVRFRPRLGVTGGSSGFVDPDVASGPSATGAAFVVRGTDGEISDVNAASVFLSQSSGTRLETLLPGETIFLNPATLQQGFTVGSYTVQRIEAGGATLVERPPPATDIPFEVLIAPHEIELEIRTRDRQDSVSLTRVFSLDGG